MRKWVSEAKTGIVSLDGQRDAGGVANSGVKGDDRRALSCKMLHLGGRVCKGFLGLQKPKIQLLSAVVRLAWQRC